MSENGTQKVDNYIENMLETIAGSVADLNVKFDSLNTKVDSMAVELSEVKSDVSVLKSDVTMLKSDVAEIKSDLSSFKEETRENFEKVNGKLADLDETVTGIVKDYHPHIIALEKEVFGHSTLAEA